MCYKAPTELVLAGNVAENWRKFRQKFEIFLKASGSEKDKEEVKVSKLLNLVGDDALDVYNTFRFAEEADKNNLGKVLAEFEAYCSPRKNEIFERFKMSSITQKEGQPFDQFLTELKIAVKTCEYGEQTDSIVRDRVVFGILDKGTQERLLREPRLTLQKAEEFCRAVEESKKHCSSMKDCSTVHALVRRNPRSDLQSSSKSHEFGQEGFKFLCKKCCYTHSVGSCPAYGKRCAYCKEKGHFAKACLKKLRKVHQLKKETLEEEDHKGDPNNVEEDPNNVEDHGSNEELDSLLYIDMIVHQGDHASSKEELHVNVIRQSWTEEIFVNESPIKFKLDTGSEASVLPYRWVKKVDPAAVLVETKTVLVAFGSADFKLKPKGLVTFQCRSVMGKEVNITFVVIEEEAQPILGLEACISLGLVKRMHQMEVTASSKEDIVHKFKDVFEGVGQVPGEYKIELKANAQPVIHAARRVPLSLHKKLRQSLDKLVEGGIIEKVQKPTDWVSNLVIIESTDGSLRLCLDPSDLNMAIKREIYMIPRADELINRLSGKTVFSVLDWKQGFYHLKLTDESADLCTFNTPFGRYRFLRLPFGVCNAPEIFQKTCENIFGHIENVSVYFDDIIIAGRNHQEHDEALNKVLMAAQKAGIKFNKSKFQFRTHEVQFVGRVISGQGVKVNPKHVRPILEMDTPKNRADVMRLLGMAKYLSEFIPNLSKISAPLRNLTKDNIQWQWHSEHDKAVEQIKKFLTLAPVLAIFDDSKPLVIQTDASKDGLGACLLQEGHPLAYASRSLTPTEQNYAQIEKELLAIVYGLERFHQLTYGRKVEVHCDHKPLESIAKKRIEDVSARLQRMKLRLLKYHITIRYVPGKYLYLADTLSRACLKDHVEDDPEMLKVVHSVEKYLPMTEERKAQFQLATQNDGVLVKLINLTRSGWPAYEKDVPYEVKYYWDDRSNIQVSSGLVFLNNKLIVPVQLRQFMLNLIHEGHSGINRCKARAREVVCWPGMASEIESMVATCQVCQRFRNANKKETMIPHEIPKRAWAKLASDIFETGVNSYLVVIDYYSKWLELVQLKNKTAPEVISKLKSMFAQFGVPDEFVSDNMPFASYEFKKFAQEWDIKLTTSSPTYPQSNGMAEKAVQTAKRMVKKMNSEGKDIHEALLEYRSTPVQGVGLSPAQLLFNKRIRSKIPIALPLLKPELHSDVNEKLLQKQELQTRYYNRGARDLKALEPGDNVLIRQGNEWSPGVVLEKHLSPRSYICQNTNGSVVRRNRKVLHASSPTKACSPDPKPDGGVTTRSRSGLAVQVPLRYRD
jgi:hypothetical protein